MCGSERGSAILEHLATQYARGVTAENQNHSMAFFRWRLDANQALGLFVAPRQDRRLQRCTTACGSSVDAPLHIRDGLD